MKGLWRLREFVMFNGVGMLNTAVDFGLFFLFRSVLGLHYLLAQLLSYAAGTANSYLLNRSLTFSSKGPASPGEALRFLGVNAASLGLASLLLYLLARHGNLVTAKATATLAGAAINYAGQKLWVFRRPPGKSGGSQPFALEDPVGN